MVTEKKYMVPDIPVYSIFTGRLLFDLTQKLLAIDMLKN